MALRIGTYNTLTISKRTDFGVYLDADNLGEILLPKRYVPKGCDVGDSITVFLYLDSDDIPIATTEKPLVTLNESALLKVKDVNHYGAFLDWGLSKDLLVPFSEQQTPLQEGTSYVVYVYQDERTERLVGTTKLGKYLREESQSLQKTQTVDLLIYGRTDLGFKAVINQLYVGVIFSNEVFQPLTIGQQLTGYIKQIRDDGKIDLTLSKIASEDRDDLVEKIVSYLKAQGGESTLTDKSAPDDIYNCFEVSKARYKKALGQLYRD
ncbi:MAG TPA: GntR family transcriptional regulator, partial [Methylococcales bacterium]|nr:GntR family transcriptional regulator [Methylococcales bacterium]